MAANSRAALLALALALLGGPAVAAGELLQINYNVASQNRGSNLLDPGAVERHLMQQVEKGGGGVQKPGRLLDGGRQREGERGLQLQQQQEQQHQAGPAKVPLLTITAMTTCMAAMSGLGALPFFFVGALAQSWCGVANAVACGVMVAASFGLIQEGGAQSGPLALAGVLLGALFISAIKTWLDDRGEVSFEDLKGGDARKVLLIIGVMAAHAVGEGSGVGVSFSGRRGWAQGTLVTLAIGLHNVPEGLAVATVMSARGASPQRACLWTVLSSLPQALVAVPSYLFVESLAALLPLATGFAGGCMLWIVFAELMPEALEQAEHPKVATAATLSAAWLVGMGMAFQALEQPDGSLRNPVQADVRTLLPFAAACLPVVACAAVSAVGALSVVKSRAAALSMAAGVQVALGLVVVLQQLAQHQLGLPLLLAWATLGALAGMGIWRLGFASAAAPALPVERKATPDLEVAGMLLGEAAPSFAANGSVYGAGVQQRQRVGSSWDLLDGKQPQQQGAATFAPSSVDSNGFVEVDHHQQQHRDKLQQQQQQQVPLPLATALVPQQNGSHPGQQLDGRQGGHSPVGILDLYSQPPGMAGLQQPAATSSGAEAYRHVDSQPVASYGLLLLLCYCCPYGMHVAAAVKANLEGAVGLALPLALLALPLGAGLAGVISCMLGHRKQLVAGAAAAAYSAGPLTALCSLAALPIGVVPSEDIAFDPAGLGPRVQVAAAGALLAGGLLVLWPAARSVSSSRAGAGLFVGGTLTVFICGVLGALCLGTPYCLAGSSGRGSWEV